MSSSSTKLYLLFLVLVFFISVAIQFKSKNHKQRIPTFESMNVNNFTNYDKNITFPEAGYSAGFLLCSEDYLYALISYKANYQSRTSFNLTKYNNNLEVVDYVDVTNDIAKYQDNSNYYEEIEAIINNDVGKLIIKNYNRLNFLIYDLDSLQLVSKSPVFKANPFSNAWFVDSGFNKLYYSSKVNGSLGFNEIDISSWEMINQAPIIKYNYCNKSADHSHIIINDIFWCSITTDDNYAFCYIKYLDLNLKQENFRVIEVDLSDYNIINHGFGFYLGATSFKNVSVTLTTIEIRESSFFKVVDDSFNELSQDLTPEKAYPVGLGVSKRSDQLTNVFIPQRQWKDQDRGIIDYYSFTTPTEYTHENTYLQEDYVCSTGDDDEGGCMLCEMKDHLFAYAVPNWSNENSGIQRFPLK